MKKILFLLIFILASLTGFGQSYYVSTAGDDGTGDGSAGNPWKTIDKAGETVRTAGSTIYVLAGSFVETDTIGVADGVSVRGAGITTIVRAPTITTAALFQLRGAAEGENGNQSISYIYFDGSDTTSYAAISIYARSNVSVHHCTFVDWKNWAVLFGGRTDHTVGAPTTYAEDNSFYNNTVTNSSRYTSFGTGALNIAGQKDMLIYNNTFAQGGRPRSATNRQTEGYLIKAYPCEGHNMGFKIYNNTFTTHANSNIWRFAIELFGVHGGGEIYDNNIAGTLDFGDSGTEPTIDDVGNYGFGVKVYDNIMYNTSLQDSLAKKIFGVDLEGDIDGGTYIYNNVITNCATGIVFSQNAGSAVDSVFIYNNVINGLGLTDYANYGSGISVGSNNTSVFTNIQIYNNSINAGALGKSPQYGIYVGTGSGSSTNFIIRNNITVGFNKITDTSRGIRVYSSTIDYINIDNNLIYDCKGTNEISYASNTLTNDTEADNIQGSDPLFISTGNLRLQAGSPAINTGYDTGLTTDADGNTRSDIDIGAYEFISIPYPVTGLGWEDVLSKRNFKDEINVNTWMINGSPVTATAAELNALSAVAQDTAHLSDRINAKADTSLSNLSSVAINTHLLPGTDGAVNLGSATYKWGNIFMDSAKVINFNNGDVTVTHSDQTLTFAGGDIVFPSTTTIGDVSSTEISYVNGVTSAIQTQLNNKADTAGAIDIGDVAYLFGDTLYSQNPAVYTQRQVDSIVSAINGYAAYRLAFIVDSTAWAPGSGDSILTVTAFIDKHLEIYRGSEGDSLYKLYRKNVGQTYHNGYSFQKATGKIVFTPHFETNEHVIIEATDSTSWTDITATSFFESEYLVVYNAMSVKPGADTAWQQNLMFKRILDTADVDIVYIFANRTNTDAYINWVDPGTFDVTDIVAPTFTKYQGITFNGSTHVVNTNFNASADSASAYFSKNNAGIGVYMRTDVGGNYCPFGARTTEDGYTRMIPNNGSNIMLANLNGPSANSTPNTTTLGMAFITRTSKTVVTNYMNSADCTENDALTSKALIPVDMYIGAYNYGGTPTYYFPGEISAFVLGEGFSIQQIAEITDAIEDYMDYLGKGVIP